VAPASPCPSDLTPALPRSDTAAVRAPGDILRLSLGLSARGAEGARSPLFPRLVEDPEVRKVVDAAAAAALAELARLFPPPNTQAPAPGSAFHQSLLDHINALLAGKDGAARSHPRSLPTLFGDPQALGKVRAPERHENYGLAWARGPEAALCCLDTDVDQFVPVENASLGALFSSADEARLAAFAWMRAHGAHPQETPVKLCLLSFEDPGPLQLTALAA